MPADHRQKMSMVVAVESGLQWLYVHDAGALETTPRFQRRRKSSADTTHGTGLARDGARRRAECLSVADGWLRRGGGERRQETRSFLGMGEASRCIYVEEGREGARGMREEAGEERNKRKKEQDNCVGRPRSDLGSSRPEEGILVGCQSQGGGTR